MGLTDGWWHVILIRSCKSLGTLEGASLAARLSGSTDKLHRRRTLHLSIFASTVSYRIQGRTS
jgi:hypothetical protein